MLLNKKYVSFMENVWADVDATTSAYTFIYNINNVYV